MRLIMCIWAQRIFVRVIFSETMRYMLTDDNIIAQMPTSNYTNTLCYLYITHCTVAPAYVLTTTRLVNERANFDPHIVDSPLTDHPKICRINEILYVILILFQEQTYLAKTQ